MDIAAHCPGSREENLESKLDGKNWTPPGVALPEEGELKLTLKEPPLEDLNGGILEDEAIPPLADILAINKAPTRGGDGIGNADAEGHVAVLKSLCEEHSFTLQQAQLLLQLAKLEDCALCVSILTSAILEPRDSEEERDVFETLFRHVPEKKRYTLSEAALCLLLNLILIRLGGTLSSRSFLSAWHPS